MSTPLAPCPKCREMNAKISEECLFCGAPLPWAAAAAVPAPYAVQSAFASATAAPIADPTGMTEPLYRGYTGLSIEDPNDRPEMWITVVSFLIPLAGIILYFSNAGRAPQRAASAGRGLMWGMIVNLVLALLVIMMSHRAMQWAATGSPNHMVVAPQVQPQGY